MKNKKLLFAFIIMLMISGITPAQTTVNCGYPIHVSADSLFNYVIKKSGKPMPDLNGVYDFHEGNKLDGVYGELQDYLIEKLGMDNYCKYVTLTVDGFRCSKQLDGVIINNLSYTVELPGQPGKESIGKVKIGYSFVVEPGKQARIQDKTVIPDCRELFKKGFLIDKEKVIEMLTKSNFIHDGDKYSIVLGIFYWHITKYLIKEAEQQTVEIDAVTGLQSPQVTHHVVY